MRQITGILFKSRENQKSWTQVKSYCYSAIVTLLFGAIREERAKGVGIVKKYASSKGRKKMCCLFMREKHFFFHDCLKLKKSRQ